MYYTYILFSEKCNRFYIGYTKNIEERLDRHNSGKVIATKNCRPYQLKKMKAFTENQDAKNEEIRLKKMKSSKYLMKLIDGDW